MSGPPLPQRTDSSATQTLSRAGGRYGILVMFSTFFTIRSCFKRADTLDPKTNF